MSRTDKHRPHWVQLKDPDNRGWREERHNHVKGFCDLGDGSEEQHYMWWQYHRYMECIYSHTSGAYHSGIFQRRPRRNKHGLRNLREGRARAAWRKIAAEYQCGGERVDENWLLPARAWLWYKWD